MKKLILAWAMIVMAAAACGQSGNLVPQGAYCLNAGMWIPVASSYGTAAPESYPPVALYGLNGTTWYPIACDASGNLIPGGAAGGDLTGTYPNPTFNLTNAHVWAAKQTFSALMTATGNGTGTQPEFAFLTAPSSTTPYDPLLLFAPTGTMDANTWNQNGVDLGFNPASGFTGNVIEQHLNGGSLLSSLDYGGNWKAMSFASATVTASGVITDNTHFDLASIGIINPTAMPVTTALANPANLNGLATNNLGQIIAQTIPAGASVAGTNSSGVLVNNSNNVVITGGNIAAQTVYALAQLNSGGALPLTTAQPNLVKSVNGLATNSLGQAIPGIQKYQLTSQYGNSTATATPIWSFPVAASSNYRVECSGRYKAASTGAFEASISGPTTPTNIGYTFQLETALSANAPTYLDYEQGVSQSYPAPINSTAVTTTATDMSFVLIVDLNNGTTPGTLSIKGNTIGTATLNVEIGSTCIVYPN